MNDRAGNPIRSVCKPVNGGHNQVVSGQLCIARAVRKFAVPHIAMREKRVVKVALAICCEMRGASVFEKSAKGGILLIATDIAIVVGNLVASGK